MVLITEINTFNDIKFNKDTKPLVICDIDHTFIRCLHDLQYFRNIVNDNFYLDDNISKLQFTQADDKEAIDLMNTAYNIGFIKQTDKEGFDKMLKTIKELGGKLIFLTARGITGHERTINELKKVGLENPENFDIHYTGNKISKGEYIKKNNLIDGYEHISFIDDYAKYISSVHNIFPHINCYLFRYIK